VYNKKVKICVYNHIVILSIKHRGNREQYKEKENDNITLLNAFEIKEIPFPNTSESEKCYFSYIYIYIYNSLKLSPQ
jgi:hypothetical protein